MFIITVHTCYLNIEYLHITVPANIPVLTVDVDEQTNDTIKVEINSINVIWHGKPLGFTCKLYKYDDDIINYELIKSKLILL